MTDVVLFIKETISEPPIIFGHSLGGMIGIQIAAYYPELVKGLIIGESPLNLEVLRESSKSLEKWQAFKEHKGEMRVGKNKIQQDKKDSTLMESMIKNVLLTDSNVITVMIDEFEDTFKSYDIHYLLPMIKCPVLILQGNPELKAIIRDEDVNIALRLLSHAKHIKLLHAGHTLHIENKNEVLQAILPFIENLMAYKS